MDSRENSAHFSLRCVSHKQACHFLALGRGGGGLPQHHWAEFIFSSSFRFHPGVHLVSWGQKELFIQTQIAREAISSNIFPSYSLCQAWILEPVPARSAGDEEQSGKSEERPTTSITAKWCYQVARGHWVSSPSRWRARWLVLHALHSHLTAPEK